MNFSKGFTLAELAIAMVIIALLLAGSMIPLTAQIGIRNISDTQRTMDGVKEAVIGFTQTNGRLPCPADGTAVAGTAGAGTELVTAGTTCTNTFGVVPWATLGVPETDSWGRRYSYWVSPIFADAISLTTFGAGCTPTPIPSLSSFALCSLGNIAVNTRSDANHAITTALGSVLPAVIISHGKNGYGAYTPGGGLPPTAPSGADEIANANHAPSVVGYTFYSRNPTSSASGCNDAAGTLFCEFDDIVVMITAPTLNARMVAAGKLP